MSLPWEPLQGESSSGFSVETFSHLLSHLQLQHCHNLLARKHTIASWRYEERVDYRSFHKIGKSSGFKNNRFSTSNFLQASSFPDGSTQPTICSEPCASQRVCHLPNVPREKAMRSNHDREQQLKPSGKSIWLHTEIPGTKCAPVLGEREKEEPRGNQVRDSVLIHAM